MFWGFILFSHQPSLCVWVQMQPAAPQRPCRHGEPGTRTDVGRRPGRAGIHTVPWTHQRPACLNHSFYKQDNRKLPAWRCENPQTHVGIRVIQLHQHVGGCCHGYFRVTKDFHLVENKGLIPGGVESVAHCHSFLGLVEKRHDGVGVWTQRNEEAFSVFKTLLDLSTARFTEVSAITTFICFRH